MDKRIASADNRIANLRDGMTILMGGFVSAAFRKISLALCVAKAPRT